MKRRIDWPERMSEALERAKAMQFSEAYYCALFAADVVLAMTDEDGAAEFRGSTAAEAYAAVGADLAAAVAGVLEQVPLAFAQRGDVILRVVDEREAVGICLGADSAFISSEGGLAVWPTLEQVVAYRVPFE